jgi:hypothetical protein
MPNSLFFVPFSYKRAGKQLELAVNVVSLGNRAAVQQGETEDDEALPSSLLLSSARIGPCTY